MTPRLPISLESRARNFCGQSRVRPISETEFLEALRLGGLEEPEQLRHVQRVGAVVSAGITGEPAGARGLGAERAAAASAVAP